MSSMKESLGQQRPISWLTVHQRVSRALFLGSSSLSSRCALIAHLRGPSPSIRGTTLRQCSDCLMAAPNFLAYGASNRDGLTEIGIPTSSGPELIPDQTSSRP